MLAVDTTAAADITTGKLEITLSDCRLRLLDIPIEDLPYSGLGCLIVGLQPENFPKVMKRTVALGKTHFKLLQASIGDVCESIDLC